MTSSTSMTQKREWSRNVANGYFEFANRLLELVPSVTPAQKLAFEMERDATVDYWNALFLMFCNPSIGPSFEDKLMGRTMITTEEIEDIVEVHQHNPQNEISEPRQTAFVSRKKLPESKPVKGTRKCFICKGNHVLSECKALKASIPQAAILQKGNNPDMKDFFWIALLSQADSPDPLKDVGTE